jgi:hypothetical protein
VGSISLKNLKNPTDVMNTAKYANPTFGDLVISGMLVPFNWTLAIPVGEDPATTLANIETALSALLINDDPLLRGYYVGPFDAFNDKSEATTYQTLGYGKKVKTQRQIITKEYQIIDGGLQYWKSLQSFTGKIDQYKWLEFGNTGIIYGTNTKSATTGAVTGIQGVKLSSLEPQDRKQANKSTVEEHLFVVSYQDGAEVNEDLFTIDTGIGIDDFVNDLGIQDIVITATGPMVAKVVSFAITSADGGVNLCSVLPALIVTASITLTNKETASTAITITSLAIVNGLAVLTLSGAGAGWIPGDHMLIKFKAVSVLSAAGFKYYESNTESVVMVA